MKENIDVTRLSWEVEADIAKATSYVFPDETIVSKLDYHAEPTIRPLEMQTAKLSELFPTLNTTGGPAITARGDGLLAIPKFTAIAGNYHSALERALDVLETQRPGFMNTRKDELDERYLHRLSRTQRFWDSLEAQSTDDFLRFPAQLGRFHLGKSARQAHTELAEGEFGLGPYEITIFLLSHPEWLNGHTTNLGIDCIGCEYGPYTHGFFKYILFFYFSQQLKFEARWCGCPDVRFGPATGFLP